MSAAPPETSQLPPQARLLQLSAGKWVTQAIYAAARLELADQFKEGPRTVQQLASAVGADPLALHRLLRALASVEIFRERESGEFELTPMAEYLRKDVPGSLHGAALMLGHPGVWLPLGELVYSVKTGKPAFDHVFGMGCWEYLGKNPELAAQFDAAMTSFSHQEAPAIVQAFDFSAFRSVADIGGGGGLLISEILRAHASVRGILFDQPTAIQRAKAHLEAGGLSARCELVAGDFFKGVPEGADAYVLKRVIHDWDDGRARAILEKVRQAMREDSTLLVIEAVLPAGNAPSYAKLLDLEMLTVLTGRERTEADFRALLASAGFRLDTVFPTRSGKSILRARPA